MANYFSSHEQNGDKKEGAHEKKQRTPRSKTRPKRFIRVKDGQIKGSATSGKSKRLRRSQTPHQHGPHWPPRSPFREAIVPNADFEGSDTEILDVIPRTTQDVLPGPSQTVTDSTLQKKALSPRVMDHNDAQPVEHHENALEHTPDHEKASQGPRQTSTEAPHSSAILHTVSDHGQTSRVSKPQKTSRACRNSVGHTMHAERRGSTQRLPDALEVYFEQIRGKFGEEQATKENEHRLKVKGLEERIAALQEFGSAQKQRIDELEAAKSELRNRMKSQVDKFGDLQKFLTGIGKDYDKLKDEKKTLERRCSSTLNAKIEEIHNEKAVLEKQFLTTIEAVGKSQRSMKQAMDDCYVRLSISESKKKYLSEELERHKMLLQEERSRHNDQQYKVLGSMQGILTRLDENSGALNEKMDSLQAAVDPCSSGNRRDSPLQHCVNVLEDMRRMPPLKYKDVEKAEAMLRYLHERLVTVNIHTSRLTF